MILIEDLTDFTLEIEDTDVDDENDEDDEEDLTDVTLVSDDTYRGLYWCDPDHPDESYLVMKCI